MKTLVLTLISFSFAAPVWAADECKAVNSACSVCADGTFKGVKVPDLKDKKMDERDTILGKAAFDCAVAGISETEGEALRKRKGCKAMSDYCGVCADGTYEFLKTHAKVKSDPYECATRPRAKMWPKKGK